MIRVPFGRSWFFVIARTCAIGLSRKAKEAGLHYPPQLARLVDRGTKSLCAKLADGWRRDVGTDPASSELQGRTIGPLAICNHEVSPRSGDDDLLTKHFDLNVHGGEAIKKGAGGSACGSDGMSAQCGGFSWKTNESALLQSSSRSVTPASVRSTML